MGRSPLFTRLRRLLRRAHAGSPPAPEGPSRRDIVKLLGGVALVPALAACGDDHRKDVDPAIAIVGGGIAGLTAAHFLALAGVRAQIFEAQMRTGGRMFTQQRAYGDQLVELGGELVDTDHVIIQALAESYGLQLDDLPALTAGLQQDRFVIGGIVLTDDQIVQAFTPVAAKMAEANMMGEADEAEFARIDEMSIPEWLELEAGLPANSVLRRLLEVAYLEEFGLEVEEQSAWNLLTLIDFTAPDPFRVFGDSDERFHIHTGSESVPAAIAAELVDQIHLDHRLAKVTASGGAFELAFTTSGGEARFTANHVVYALPFTKLREVDLSASALSAEKTTIIRELGYGTNAKLMMLFTTPKWQDAPLSSSGGVITDTGELQSTWATSRGQAGTTGILTNFVGGDRGVAIGEGTPESQAQTALPWIDEVFPGVAASYVADSAIRQHWPSFEFTKGSYASYRKGQWAFFGLEGKREGNQHFCGEHCSEDFQGYMEGGADTGALVAAEILDDLGIAHPPALAALLAMTAARPRASYHAGRGARMKLSQIRKRRYR
ncbi:MAG: FAD-dependent oxidoreductase [Deltaproteobacteria bacterium]|nr:FAD-dependent oxidoreductase [Deltaproteobacteria bacterium]